jgi:tRNA(His) 5'-end guanylyltransferase
MKLGDRMKDYEYVSRNYLTKRTPVIVRVDGKAFRTFTKDFDRPFDHTLGEAMITAAMEVFGFMQCCKLAYIQSDEASFVITDYDNLDTQGWFGYNRSKIETISASCMTMSFNRCMRLANKTGDAMFDARAFNVPRSEVANYFLWRAQDWHRNSVSMFAQAHFSHKELHKRNISDLHDMLHDIGKNWTLDLSGAERNGTFLYRKGMSIVDNSMVLPAYKNIERHWCAVCPKED